MRGLVRFGIGFFLLLAAGCGHVLSEEALRTVDPALDLTQVRADPEAFRGSTLLLGGKLIDTRVEHGGTTLEVFSYRLDSYGKPIEPDEAGGRFLARTTSFLDPELYQAGALVTLTGTLVGQEVRSLQGVNYTYPIFELGELHLWQPAGREPMYYDPFYPWPPYPYYYNYPRPYLYDYPYDPFWYPGYYRWY